MPRMPQLEDVHKAEWETVVEEAMRAAVREAIERVVDEELAAALGPRYVRQAGRTGYRHGTKVSAADDAGRADGSVGAARATPPA